MVGKIDYIVRDFIKKLKKSIYFRARYFCKLLMSQKLFLPIIIRSTEIGGTVTYISTCVCANVSIMFY